MTLRDGARKSLWQDTTAAYTPVSVPAQPEYDVIIAGGGMTGITLALELQKSGKRCVVLEANTLGFGTTGGTTAHLNTLLDTPYPTIIKNFSTDEARIVARSARQAIDLVQKNVKEYAIDCGFEMVPGYLFAQDARQVNELEKIHDACLDVGVAAEYTAYIDVPVPFTRAIKIPRQAKFHPMRYLQALAGAFERAGGVIIERCRVQGAERAEETGTIDVNTTLGHFYGDALVYATHIPIGVNVLHLRCPAFRSYAMAVKLANGAQYPAGLAYDMYDPYHYYRAQKIDNDYYLIVGGEDHKTGEEPNTNGQFLKLESHIRSHFDVEAIVDQWSSQYFESVDGLPYIGHLPGKPENVYVATGYGGNGMTYSHVAAMLIRDRILGRMDDALNLFNPARVKPVAGFTEFVKHNADVARQFVGKWFGREEIEQISELAPGEGKVVTYEDRTLALYKDETGGLHAVSPTCTHLKCSVNWNAAEKSWDCPCHGARYSFNGEVLTGPASKGLEKVELRSLVAQDKH